MCQMPLVCLTIVRVERPYGKPEGQDATGSRLGTHGCHSLEHWQLYPGPQINIINEQKGRVDTSEAPQLPQGRAER